MIDSIDEQGAQRLMAELISTAVEEYRSLVTAGLIADGAIVKSMEKKFSPQDLADARDLIRFFKGIGIENCLNVMRVNLAADAVRIKLGISA